LKDYRATSAESDALSADLKQRGFKFIGSTVCYAHMQATGMVNDHAIDCFRRSEILASYGCKKGCRSDVSGVAHESAGRQRIK